MTIALVRSSWQACPRWEKFAIVVWAVILAFVCVRSFFWPDSKTVYPIFSYSSCLWWRSVDLYEPHRPVTIETTTTFVSDDNQEAPRIEKRRERVQGGFRYLPAFAIVATPFSLLPNNAGGVLWRLCSVASLLGALIWFVRAVLPVSLTREHFAWLLLFCIPLSLQSVNNGQANILVIAAMLGAVAAVKAERWNVASLLLSLAFICKVYPVALGMLLMVLYPRKLGWRVPLYLLGGLALPFLFQRPAYVLDQYSKWVYLLRHDDRSAIELESMYRDLWLLIRLYDLPIQRELYMIFQAISGGAIAAVIWCRQRNGWSEKALLTSTLALAAAWMMLLGPATESSSFILLAPPLAWSVLEGCLAGSWQRRHWLLCGSLAYFLVAVLMGGFTTTVKIHALGVHSWASMLYLFYLLTERKASVPFAGPHVRWSRVLQMSLRKGA